MRIVLVAVVLAMASCPTHYRHETPICTAERPEWLGPCRLYASTADAPLPPPAPGTGTTAVNGASTRPRPVRRGWPATTAVPHEKR